MNPPSQNLELNLHADNQSDRQVVTEIRHIEAPDQPDYYEEEEYTEAVKG